MNHLIYFLIDTSGSMYGTSINEVNKGLKKIREALINEPWSLESVKISIITFNYDAELHLRLSSLFDIVDPSVEALISGPKNLGSAFLKIIKVIENDRANLEIRGKRYFDPLVFTIINGKPSDPELLKTQLAIMKELKLRGLVGFAKEGSLINSDLDSIFDHFYEYKNLSSVDMTKSFLEIYNYLFIDSVEWTIDHQIWPFENEEESTIKII